MYGLLKNSKGIFHYRNSCTEEPVKKVSGKERLSFLAAGAVLGDLGLPLCEGCSHFFHVENVIFAKKNSFTKLERTPG